ncbi:RCC1 domain-containing protein, partial [Pyxidicoccus sp. 3LFB2]
LLASGFYSRSRPAQVAMTGLVEMVAGGETSLALSATGALWAGGTNDWGQLGNGTTTSPLTPGQVQGLGGVVSAAAGGDHMLAVRDDGTVWAWGYNADGQLGHGVPSDAVTPSLSLL